ncbi:Uncharacterized protein dnm_089300 [Desulfonema magnum]|uniref:Uncharacterized protein n=1 Tax=Desulfonema magnum TaxID=45655 RepID=A0A975BWL1_9BACT|nr:Uncharacterized protein dnm_089300 [Desulfonema magnum]
MTLGYDHYEKIIMVKNFIQSFLIYITNSLTFFYDYVKEVYHNNRKLNMPN